jgi:hypothetical protein
MYRIKVLGSKLSKDWIIVLNTGKFSLSRTVVCNPQRIKARCYTPKVAILNISIAASMW